MDTTYSVKAGTFEGPFEVLLELIEKRKLFINDISLASVTDDFLLYLKNMQNADAAALSSFIVVAATLILLKSRSLLPNFNLTTDEEKDVGDLEMRLRLYQTILSAGETIKKIFGRHTAYEKRFVPRSDVLFVPSTLITAPSMHASVLSALHSMPKLEKLPQHEVKKVISIEEMLTRLADRMQAAVKTRFSDFVGVKKPENREEKVLVIVGFLAMLELVRQGIMDVFQHEQFADMEMERLAQDSSVTL